MKILLSIIIALFAINSYADVNSNASSNATSGSVSGSTSTSGALSGSNSSASTGSSGAAAGVTFSPTSTTYAPAADLSKAVPGAVAPALSTTLTETCMGSTSAGATAAGWGVSFGTTWRDSACVRRLDARQMSAFGDMETAREMMCDSDLVREAALRAGRPCVADGGKALTVAPQASVNEVPTGEAAAAVVRQKEANDAAAVSTH